MEQQQVGMLTVGHQFPYFQMQGVDNNNQMVAVDQIEEKNDRWSVIYFYPKDFTFICPTEISAMDILSDHAEVIGISGDNEYCKLAWKNDNDLIGNIRHTLAADCGLQLSHQCGIVDYENGVCYRATFILDENRTIQHVSVNALDTGRNAEEVLRTLQALQAGGLTGCSWNPEDEFVG
jgi:peroxiredoxin (alkyl hydroperoxide reductase subunit C)